MRTRGDGQSERAACEIIADTMTRLRSDVLALEPDRTERMTLALYLIDMLEIAVKSDKDDPLYTLPGI